MLVQVDEVVRFTYIRDYLFEICSVICGVHDDAGLGTPVLTGAGPDADAQYADEPSHQLGFAFDFRLPFTALPGTEASEGHAANYYLAIRSRLLSLSSKYRVLMFLNGNCHDGPTVIPDPKKHPNHIHVAYQRG